MVPVEIMVLRGAAPSSVAITFDVLACANRVREASGRPAAFAVRATGSGARAARAFVGGRDEGDEPAIVIVPGLNTPTEGDIRARMQLRDAGVARQRLVSAMSGGAEVATSCSGTFLVASAGLLDGRRATVTWWLAPLFRQLHPDVSLDPDALVVTDGPVTTAGAAMAQLDLMLAIVTRHAGPRLADACARYLLLDQRRSQARYMALGYLAAADQHVARAERWARDRLGEPFTVDELAAVAGLGSRTFARRVQRATGLSPVRFVQRLRVDRATELIETTRLPFEEIARQVGYAEPSTLRRIIQRDFGSGPRRLRGTARPAG